MTINEAGSQPQAESVVSSGPGVMLSQAREAKGWTQADVARRLNLRVAVIESIDQDHYKAGVALTFLRGYVKAYAKVVSVPEAQVLAAFDSMSQAQFKPDVPMKSFSKKTRQQASDQWLKRISWLVLLGLVASLVYWWWHDAGARQQGLTVEPAGAPTQVESEPAQSEPTPGSAGVLVPEAVTPSSDESINGVAEQPTENGAIDGPATEASATDGATGSDAATADEGASATAVAPTANAAVAEPDVAPAVAATSANARLLSLTFTANCWIKVTDSKGKVLSEGVKNAQQPLALEGEPPFSVILGAPHAARLEYMNQKVDLSSFNAGRAARLTVPQS